VGRSAGADRIRAGEDVRDVGCGNGEKAIELAVTNGAASMVGVGIEGRFATEPPNVKLVPGIGAR
jgi:ubiquinone/menaquinone biosynthesis C-methylase UbiE